MEKNNLKLIKKTVENKKDTDLYIRDAYGEEHIVFPKQKKTIIVLEIKKKKR